MNCPKCGTVLADGANMCPVCGASLSAPQSYSAPQGGYDPTAYGGYSYPNAYGQPPYQQGGFDPTAGGPGGYAPGGYPQGYRQVYGRYDMPRGSHGEFLTALGNLPRVITGMFRNPGETLHGMMERNDKYTGGVTVAITLLLTFFAAILLMRGTVWTALTGLSGLLGTSLAGDAASMNQGVNYIAGKMGASVGGIAALCQLIAILFPATVVLVYLCVVKKVRFSFLLASNLTAIVTLPTIGAALLCLGFSLVSPYLGLFMVLIGEVASYVLLCALVAYITGMAEKNLVVVKIALICAAEILKLLFIYIVGGALATSALATVSGLVSSMGSLL